MTQSTGTPLWLAAEPLILASSSRTRSALLSAAGIRSETVPADIDERAIEAQLKQRGASASAVATALAREKARSISLVRRRQLVLGADQTLELAGEMFAKPLDRTAAAKQLATLSGRIHTLHAAIAIWQDGSELFQACDDARLTMRPLTAAFISRYLDAVGDAACASVGAYQLEGLGIHLFDGIVGDHTTILGLPLLPLFAFLRSQGCIAA